MGSRVLAIVVGVFVVLIGTALCQEPEITKEIIPEIKRVGETGRLNCTITRQNNNKAYWIYERTQQTITSDDSVYLDEKLNKVVDGFRKYEVKKTKEGDRNTYTLIIRRLQRDDAGKYTCKIHVKGTALDPQKDGEIIVLMAPSISAGKTTMVVKVQEGGNVTLICDASGYPPPRLKWVRGNGKLLPSPIDAFSYKGGVMQLDRIQAKDNGVYRCLADNDVKPPAQQDATVYVEFKPVVKPVQSSYGQAQRLQYSVTIECLIEGFPEPDLTWSQEVAGGWKSIQNDDWHKINVISSHGGSLSLNAYWFQLVIINVRANDYGTYMCKGRNRKGTDSALVTVYETSECQGANCPMEVIVRGGVAKTTTSVLLTSLLFSIVHVLYH